MKIYKIFLLLFCVTAFFTSCETYGDPDVDYSSVEKMSGEWVIRLNDANTKALLNVLGYKDDKVPIYTYNTSDGSKTQMWLRIGSASISATSPYAPFAVKGKVNIDLGSKTFSASDVENGFFSGKKFSVSEGKVILDGTVTPSGGKADSISFKLTSDLHPGITYIVSGYRRTGWHEDDPTAAGSISLAKTTVSLAAGTSTTVAIKKGNGTYTIESSAPAIATATIVENNDPEKHTGTITINGHAAGGAKITIKDMEGRSENIIVTVE